MKSMKELMEDPEAIAELLLSYDPAKIAELERRVEDHALHMLEGVKSSITNAIEAGEPDDMTTVVMMAAASLAKDIGACKVLMEEAIDESAKQGEEIEELKAELQRLTAINTPMT